MTTPDDSRPAGEARVRTVACPTCGKRALYAPGNEWRPFCSERCRLIDLGAWASEAYRVPDRPAASDETPEPDPPKTPEG